MTGQPEGPLGALDAAQLDRAAGVLVGLACGDALGAGYEGSGPMPAGDAVSMRGQEADGSDAGEWTDDTAMAVAIAEVAADGLDLRGAEALTRIGRRWSVWASDTKDIGMQTQTVLDWAGPWATGEALAEAAAMLHRLTYRTAGNGSLMRTAPVALAYLDDAAGLVQAAHAVSALTHHDREAGEACALWCLAIRHAVLEGTFDGLTVALGHLPAGRSAVWSARLRQAELEPPAAFGANRWVVQALQGAWSAITHTGVPAGSGVQHGGRQHLMDALETAVRGGGDTDTVAAIAGCLLGARWGASAVPESWLQAVHGWPGIDAPDLARLARTIAGHSARSS